MNVRIHQFCAGKEDATLLPPMPSNVRQTVLFLLQQYGLNSSLRGSGDKKILNVYRTKRTHIPPQWKQLDKVAMEKFKGKRNAHFMPKSTPPKTPKAPDNAARPKLGDIVGEKASPIAESNIGHKMLAAMGWTPGQGLGASGAGIVDPVAAIVRSKRGGLGGE
ncbi:G-patch domain-containing protein [Gorgonomyces haynaldii]|nr:G-patch domain-containing protein [Gorgonomyces haynaldii]